MEGANTVYVHQIDVAGNTSAASTLSFTLDTQVAAPSVALTTDSGSSAADQIADDGALNVGNLEAGATVEYSAPIAKPGASSAAVRSKGQHRLRASD